MTQIQQTISIQGHTIVLPLDRQETHKGHIRFLSKIRKHKAIKGSDKYFTLDISLHFDSMEKMKITSSE